MRRLNEFGLYVAIRRCEATADRLERRGRRRAAAAERRRVSRYRTALHARLDAILAHGAGIPGQVRPTAAGRAA